MRQPFLGAIVLYTDPHMANDATYWTFPAIVTSLSDGAVSCLTVFYPTKEQHLFAVRHGAPGEPGCWSWPEAS